MNSIIINLILEMKSHAFHNGYQIVDNDLPQQLMLGWSCMNTNKTWSLRLTKVKQDMDSNNLIEVGNFLVGKGRKELLKFINYKIDYLPLGEEVDRYLKLKAFW